MSSGSKNSMTSDEYMALKLRRWQMEINEDLKKKRFKVPVHLGLGTEALVVAIASVIHSGDNLLLTHRNAAFNLVLAKDPRAVVREYEGLEDGLASGQLGSMNLANPKSGVVYSSSILANNISVACGCAYGHRISQSQNFTVVLTGDGAMEEGAFYEGLVFAKSHQLPLVIVVDNNDYSMASKISERRCEIDLSVFCESIGVNYLQLSDNDVQSYVAEFKKLRDTVTFSNSPTVVEVKTTLLNQHAGPTPGWPTDPMKVEISHGLVIEETASDPIFVLREKYGVKNFSKFETELGSAKLYRDVG
jgi:TPP-dependent pyruvate/acetoin dehydrogenase alpha subunit